jgi:uncharacterized RDD family membrane protein YckC
VITPDLDTLIEVETPEGILLELHPAGLVPRLYAYLIDLAVRWTVLIIAATILVRLGGIGVAAWMISIFLLEWLYPVAFELFAGGATPGKRALGLIVVMDNALPITPAASVIRNLLRVADFLPFAYGAGIITLLCRSDFKRLGDLAAGSCVVYRPTASSAVKFDEVSPRPPSFALSPRAQAAVILLAARTTQLSRERVDELAALAAAPTGLAAGSGTGVTERLLGIAQWLLGRDRDSV